MAISYPLTFPTDLGVESFRVIPRVSAGRNESPFSFAEQIYDWGGQILGIEATMPKMNRETAEIFNAFLFSLNGRVGTFLMPIPGAGDALGVATGTPLVNGGSQTGNELDTDGWTPSQTNILKAGTWLSLGSGSSTRLYKNLVDVDSNGSGEATLTLWPNLRSSPADNAAIDITNPHGLFRMDANVQPIDITGPDFYSFSFKAWEALDGT